MPVRLFGRDDERGVLREVWERAQRGQGGVVAVTGDPGIGKSALVHAVADELAACGAAVTRGRAWEAGEAPAYFPLWPCLRSVGVPRPDAHEAIADEFRRWEDVLVALATASHRSPVVWVVEDLHAADAQTLDLLAFLAQPLRSVAVLVLVTMRSADARLDESKLRRVAQLLRSAHELRLEPLQRDDVAAFVRASVRDVPDHVVDELTARTGGNPLFLVECTRTLSVATQNDWRHVALPLTLRASVLERIDALPSRTRTVLHDAAILGDEAFSGVLARMADSLPATVIDALAPAVRAGILVELAPGRFRFVHALVRDVIVDAQPAEVRAQAHARAADALLHESAPEAVVERAHHALSSGATTGVRAIVEAAVALLVQQGTHDRAQHLFARWLTLSPPTVADLVTSSRLAHAAGNYAEARTRALEALALAREQTDAEGLARAALALGADLRPGLIDVALVRALEEALAIVPPAATALRCRLQARHAAALQPATDLRLPVALARDAIATARTLDDDEIRRDVLLVAGAALIDATPRDEMRALATELLDLSHAAGDVPGTLRAYARVVVEAVGLGDLFAFDAHLDAMLVLARAAGHPRLIWRALLLDSMRNLARGRFDDSERLVTQVERLASLTDDPALALSLVAHVTVARPFSLYQRDLAMEGIVRSTTATALPDTELIQRHLRSSHALHFRDRRAATALLADDAPHNVNAAMGVIRAALCGLAGSPSQCRACIEALEPIADWHIVEGHIPMTYSGTVRGVLASLYARVGEPARAQACWREVLATFQTHRYAPWVARTELELGEHLHALGDPEGAELLRAAMRDAEALGLPWLVGEAQRVLAGSQPSEVRPPTTSASPRVHAFAIAREGAVWRVTLGERIARVGDARGLDLLSRLVMQPGEEIHVLVLASDDGSAAVPDSHAGELLDAQAIASYRARLDQLRARIDDANDRADTKRVDALRRERDMLEQEVARAVGLGGRQRAAASVSERARINVQRRLKDAIARIDKQDPEIGRYLRAAVRTGTYCTFRP